MENEECRKQLELKDKQILSLKNEIQTQDEKLRQISESIPIFEKKVESAKELERQIQNKNNLIQTIQESIKLKDNQLDTYKDSLHLKDEQIKMLETSLKTKDSKIETLEKTLKLKNDEIESLGSHSLDPGLLEEKEKEIEIIKKENEDFRKEIKSLTEELAKADEDLEKLELESEKLQQSKMNSGDSKIINFSNQEITKDEILNQMRDILKDSLHSVTITVPIIEDLQNLYLYEVRSSVNMKISCEINPGIEEHTELLDEYESLDNISLRHFDGADRFIINRDGEELLVAIKGSHENNHLVFKTKDPSHIKFLNSIVMESWLRSKKL